MNLFDRLVDEALKNYPTLSPLRIVVEKELLHHDILRILNHHNLLKNLTFIGGTCLRCCYGGVRLSEDLDFTGGKNFTRESLSELSQVLIENIDEKYGFSVEVSEPVKEEGNVDTWKIRIETRPEQNYLPSQRIHIDICSVPSYEVRPMMLLNLYGIDMGTSGLIIQSQSREEIYSDKLLAFAYRPNRIKYRDLWDIIWLHQQGLKPRYELVLKKLQDRDLRLEHFFELFNERRKMLLEDHRMKIEFKKEMLRFLPMDQVHRVIEQENLWDFIVNLMNDLYDQTWMYMKK